MWLLSWLPLLLFRSSGQPSLLGLPRRQLFWRRRPRHRRQQTEPLVYLFQIPFLTRSCRRGPFLSRCMFRCPLRVVALFWCRLPPPQLLPESRSGLG